MFDFSGDEMLCLIASGTAALVGFVQFYLPVFSIPLLGRSAYSRTLLAILPPVILIATSVVLNHWSDPQVAGHADYMLLFLIVELAWFSVTAGVLRVLGVGIRDDVIDRSNPAALTLACGGISSVSIVYALANVGGGPTIWTTIGPAAAGTAVLFTIWLLMECIGNFTETVTIDRDIASALRTAGAWVACGLVLGRAVGGTWVSSDQMWKDLAGYGWPGIVIGVSAGVSNRLMKPTPRQPRPDAISRGLLPGAVFLLLGVFAFACTPHAIAPFKW